MPPNVKNVVEEPEGSWPDHSASNSFIDLDISDLDLVPSKDYARRSSSSHRPKAKEMRNGNAWGEANELQSNLHIEVGDRRFHLHKFPLISKSGKLNRLVFELRDPGKDRIALHDVPGGVESFEIAVRFLYGKLSVALTSANVAALRCAAEFLEMNDSLGDGSLVAKTEHYLNLVVVGSWKDSIAVLRSCSDLKPWAEELEIVRRCSESVAWKACTDPHGLRWSYSTSTGGRDAPRGWWFGDVCSLHIDTFTKVINAVIAKGMDYTMVAAVVVQYAEKWLGLTKDSKTLPRNHDDSPKSDGSAIVAFTGFSLDVASKAQIRNRAILQGVVSLLPAQPDSVSCKFLLKLLRAACAVNAGPMSKTDLARRISVQLEKVTVDELLIPAYSAGSDAMYDIDVVHQIVEYYLQDQQSSGSPPLSPTGSAGQSSISGGTSTTGVTSVTTSSSSDRSVSGSSNSGSSISCTTDSRSSMISRSSISGTSVSRSRTSISLTTSSMSDSSGSDESATTGKTSSSDEGSVKLDSRFEKSKFFSTEGPTRRPQLPPTLSNLKVAHLLETFLEEIAKDSNIPVGKFVALADLFVDFPRESDDCVYRAIDTFLRSHTSLNDLERRKLCKVMDIQALSLNACMHAASNERLPLRVVVQVLFTEQVKLRNAITGTAVVNDKGVGSIPACFSSSNSRDTYSESSVDPLSSSSTSGTDTSTTSLSNSTTTGTTSSSNAYSLSIQSVAPSAAPSAAPSVVSSVMPGGLNVKDTLRSALSEIELLRTALQEVEMVKARLGCMDVLQQEMENINRKFMDLAHDYTGMTHQVEELTKASKHKGGWTSGWKKMAKPFHGKDHPEPQKGYNPNLMSEKHLKASADTIPLYQQMNILHPTDVPLLQNPMMIPVQAAVKTPVPEPPKAVPAAAASRIPEAKVETPLKVIVMPKVEAAPKLEPVIVPQAQPAGAEASPLKENGADAQRGLRGDGSVPLKVNGVIEHHGSKDNYQPPRPSFSEDQPVCPSVSKEQPARDSVSKDEPARRSVSETPRNQRDSSSSHHHHHHHHHDHKHAHASDPRGHQSRTPPSDARLGRHHGKDSDTVSVSSDYSYSSTHSNSRHRHHDTSSSHRSEDRSHRRNSQGHGGHKSHNPHRDGSRSRSPDDHHRCSHYSPDHHRHDHHSKDPPRPSFAANHKHGSDHHHSKDPPRAISAGNHKHGSDHHSGHHGHHSKPHHRSHRKHHHRKDYDSAPSYSSDSGSPRPSRPRRHSGV